MENNNSVQALAASAEKTYDPAKRFKRKVIICSYCKKKGHIKVNCFKRKRDEANSKETPGSSNDIAFKFNESKEESMFWYIDSGSSCDICQDKRYFDEKLTELNSPITVQIGDGRKILATQKGNITAVFKTTYGRYSAVIQNVLFMPESKVNLLSVVQIQEQGYSVLFEKDYCHVFNKDTTALKSNRAGNGYIVKAEIQRTGAIVYHASNGSTELKESNIWHQRLGHVSETVMSQAQSHDCWRNGPSKDIPLQELPHCKGCNEEKMVNRTFKSKGRETSKILPLIHSDVCRPMQDASIGGNKYFLVFIDDFSRMTFVYFMKRKSEVFDLTRNFINLIEKQTGQFVRRVRSDNGGEHIADSLSEYFAKKGILHDYTAPYTPQQNEVAERCNRTLLEKARCMIYGRKVPI